VCTDEGPVNTYLVVSDRAGVVLKRYQPAFPGFNYAFYPEATRWVVQNLARYQATVPELQHVKVTADCD
jgi:hypothetical protein